ncbi:hypothetical protein VUR80DRAFT_2862 [Thermomyces stellatus]
MGAGTTSPTPTLVNGYGQLVPFINLMEQTDRPGLIDNGNGAVGGDGIPTTYYLDLPEDVETGEHNTQATVTMTTAPERVTVTVTMTPSTLATLLVPGARIETATSTITAAPLGTVCATTGTAVGVPIACILGTGALMFGSFLWYRRKRSLSDKRRLEAAVAALRYSDGPSDDPTAPLAIPRPRNGGIGDGPRSGIIAPPSSLASDQNTPLGNAPVLRFPDNSTNDGQDNQTQSDNHVGGYGTMPQAGANIDDQDRFNWPANGSVTRRSSIATVVSNAISRGEFVGIEGGSDGLARLSNQLRTVLYVSPSNESGTAEPVIRRAQTAPLRAVEVVSPGHASQRASIVEVTEEQQQEPDIPDDQERHDIAELEGSPVPRRFSAVSNGKDGERASASSDESEAETLGRNSTVEPSTDNPVHELDTDGAAALANADQRDNGKKSSDEVSTNVTKVDSTTKDGGKAA